LLLQIRMIFTFPIVTPVRVVRYSRAPGSREGGSLNAALGFSSASGRMRGPLVEQKF
jgi:hypothetical protein